MNRVEAFDLVGGGDLEDAVLTDADLDETADRDRVGEELDDVRRQAQDQVVVDHSGVDEKGEDDVPLAVLRVGVDLALEEGSGNLVDGGDRRATDEDRVAQESLVRIGGDPGGVGVRSHPRLDPDAVGGESLPFLFGRDPIELDIDVLASERVVVRLPGAGHQIARAKADHAFVLWADRRQDLFLGGGVERNDGRETGTGFGEGKPRAFRTRFRTSVGRRFF